MSIRESRNFATLRIGRLDVTTHGGAQGAIDAEGDVNVEGKVHASRFELDSAPNFAAGNEFNDHFAHAITKHALPIGTVVMYDSGADTAGGSQVIPNGYAPCDGGFILAERWNNIVHQT